MLSLFTGSPLRGDARLSRVTSEQGCLVVCLWLNKPSDCSVELPEMGNVVLKPLLSVVLFFLV